MLPLDGEIRTWLRGLSPSERNRALNDAAAARDVSILKAVTNAPGALIGYSADAVNMFKTKLFGMVESEFMAEARTIHSAIDAVNHAHIELLRHVDAPTDFGAANQAKATDGAPAA